MKKISFIIWLLLLAQICEADNNPVGTWSGTWINGSLSESLTLTLKNDYTLEGSFRQPLEPYGSSGTVTLPISGTYSFNSVSGYLVFACEGTAVVQGYTWVFYIDGAGYGSGDNATGDYWLTSYYYEAGYWWLVDDSDHGTFSIHRTSLPSKVKNPFPSHGANDQPLDIELSWLNGGGATSFNVYFGTDNTPDSGESKGNRSGTSYNPGTLSYDTTYYWRIDSKNSNGTTTGDVWHFTTESSPSLFDSDSDVITNPWLGLTNVGDSYSLAGYGTFSGAERTYSIVGSEQVDGVNCLVLQILGHGEYPATEYYEPRIAEDVDGNLRVLKITGIDGDGAPMSWEPASVSDSPVFLPGNPQVGEVFPLWYDEYHEVIALNQTVPQMSTGMGPYTGCMQYRWGDPSEDDIDEKYHCLGVGIVKEVWNDDGLDGWERVSLGNSLPDFNGDGKMDILWCKDSTGLYMTYLMDGLTKTSQKGLGGIFVWEVWDLGDFNGDGKTDIVWRKNATGYCMIQLMDGSTVIGVGGLGGDLEWEVLDLGDFNGDGKMDILWRKNTTGICVIQLMDGVTRVGGQSSGTGNLDWDVWDLGDFNGDNKTDILWRKDSTGLCMIHLMNGLTTISQAGIGGDLDWEVVPLP